MPDDTNPYRLPRSVVPRHYSLSLEPDLDAAVFAGRVSIEVDVVEETAAVVLNAAELDLVAARCGAEEASVTLDAEAERATLTFAAPLPAGIETLEVEFAGVLNDKLRGFYRSTFTDEAGEARTIATTQFEATDARRAFPCFDEPDLKATFDVELVVADGLACLSNGPVEEEEQLSDGRRRVRFARTMKMPTYLVALIVGPLTATEPVDVDGVPLRVVHVPGKEHLSAFGLEIGAFALRYFADYYGIPYPAQKLDLVALPDFAAGAMENLGCVTFRETLLLVDPETITQPELTRVADVVAHEIAHMWFGDLVTMKWWNGLWLNEAFATFMEVACVDAWRPAWGRWLQFGLERSQAFDVDSLEATRPIEYPVESPEDAEGMFDVLTYEKGGSVLRMLEQYLGADGYRDGIRHYLDVHKYGNTETGDLWDAIEKVTGQPARRIMDTWIFQGGYPVVGAALTGRSLTLSQSRFRYTDDPGGEPARWAVPVLVRAGDDVHRVLLDEQSATIEVPADATVVVNAGGHGFYRAHYDPVLLGRASASLATLEPIERYLLLDDTFANVLAGRVAALDFLDLADGYADEAELPIWKLLTGQLGQVERLLEGEGRQGFRRRARELCRTAFERLGWEPADEEAGLLRELRGVLLLALGVLCDDAEVQARAARVHDSYLADPHSVEPNVAAAIAGIVAHTGSAADWERFSDRFRTAPTPQEQVRYLYALAGFPDIALFGRTLAMLLTDEVRTQNAPFVLALMLGHREHGRVAWDFVAEKWERINERFPSNTIVRMLGGVKALSRPDDADAVIAFFEAHELPQGRRQLQQHLEKLRVNVAFRAREAGRLAAGLQ